MRKYYVYILINSLDGVPFYVGKGTGDRMFRHKKESLKGKDPQGNSHLGNKIRKIIRLGGDIEYQVTKDLLLEESYDLEIKKIKEIGRSDLGLGPLCNMTDGGDGVDHLTEEVEKRRVNNCIDAHKNPAVKKKVSDGLKRYHKSMSEDEKKRRSEILSQRAKDQIRPPNIGDLIRNGRENCVPWNKGKTYSDDKKESLSLAHKNSQACKSALERLWEENRRTGRLKGKNSACYIHIDQSIIDEIVMLYSKGWGIARIRSYFDKIKGISLSKAIIINRIKESGVSMRKSLTFHKESSTLDKS